MDWLTSNILYIFDYRNDILSLHLFYGFVDSSLPLFLLNSHTHEAHKNLLDPQISVEYSRVLQAKKLR
jgi:hypothetical protein